MAILGHNNRLRFIREFGLAEWLNTRGLAGWLEIATDKLDAPAKQRIAREIEVHYAEAVHDHMAAGEAELSAQATAMLELGDPTVAALSFQKSHLTESEAKSIKWMEWAAAKPLFSFWALLLDGIPLGGVALLLSHLHGNPRDLLDFHFFASLVLVSYAGFRLIPRLLCARTLPRTSFIKGLALSIWLTDVALVSCYALFIYTRIHNVYVGGFFGLYLVLLHTFRRNSPSRIWNKLRKMGDARNELPPWQTPAS